MALTDGLLTRHLLDEGTGTLAADSAGTRDGSLNTASWVNDATHGNVWNPTTLTHRITCSTGSLVTTNNLTVAFRARIDTLPAFNGRIVGHRIPSAGNISWLVYADGNQHMRFQVSGDGTNLATEATIGGTFFSLGTWFHTVVTFSAGVANFYKDGATTPYGVTNGTLDQTTIFDATTSPLYFGAYDDGDTSMLGLLSDVAIWNRVLTEAERTDVYNGTWTPAIRVLATLKELDGITGLPSTLENVRWAWFDTVPGAAQSVPVDYGTTLGIFSGVLEIPLPNTTLTAGQYGYLVLEHQASGRRQAYRLQVTENA